MIPPPSGGNERKLARIYRSLDEENRRTLLTFAEFLAGRAVPNTGAAPVIRRPESIPRPERESVVAAIKRLSLTYPMLERGSMLNETSTLMAAHVLSGRPAAGVIDELEVLFARHYAKYREQFEREGV